MKAKIAIIGYTPHKMQAPFLDPEWETWGLNDLYLDLPPQQPKELVRWYQLHQFEFVPTYVVPPNAAFRHAEGPAHPRDPNHLAALRQLIDLGVPVYVMSERKELAGAHLLPRDEIRAYFSKHLKRTKTEQPFHYFTNSITWMIAHAIMELAPNGKPVKGAELGIFGVDMMVGGEFAGSEYGYQRPSCEWAIGFAMGLGIPVTLPDESDLLSAAFDYGDERANAFRNKVQQVRQIYSARHGELEGLTQQHQMMTAEVRGSRNAMDALLANHMPGDTGNDNGTVPLPGMDKVRLAPPGPVEVEE